MRRMMFAAAVAVILLASVTTNAQNISGDYIETRSADVWTGSCVANGERNLVAIRRPRVARKQRRWNGVSLSGSAWSPLLRLTHPRRSVQNPYPAKAVMIVEKSLRAQPKALVEFAQSMAGELLRTSCEPRLHRSRGSQRRKRSLCDHAGTRR